MSPEFPGGSAHEAPAWTAVNRGPKAPRRYGGRVNCNNYKCGHHGVVTFDKISAPEEGPFPSAAASASKVRVPGERDGVPWAGVWNWPLLLPFSVAKWRMRYAPSTVPRDTANRASCRNEDLDLNPERTTRHVALARGPLRLDVTLSHQCHGFLPFAAQSRWRNGHPSRNLACSLFYYVKRRCAGELLTVGG